MQVKNAHVCTRCNQSFPDWYSLSVHWVKVEKQPFGKSAIGDVKVWKTEDMERACRKDPRRFEAVRTPTADRLEAVIDHDDDLVFTEQEDGEWRGREI